MTARLYTRALLLTATFLFAGCAYNVHLEDGAAARLADYLSGEFSSAAQANQDEAYYPVHLSVTPIWTERTDGHWLYVEQALESRREAPYRQRVYHVYRLLDEIFVSEVYTLADPTAAIGAPAAALARLGLDDLSLKQGCTVFLRPTSDGGFSGATQGRGCASELNGASYATSSVEVSRDAIVSWDRGYDASGNQVWGAEHGPYRFERISGDE